MLSFMLLAVVLSWWPWPLYALDLAPSPIVGFGPFLAALAVLGATRGRLGVRSLLSSMVQWRVRPTVYLAAIALPVGTQAAAAVLNVALGAEVHTTFSIGEAVGLVPTFLLFLLIPGAGGTWEEPGWRGYALRTLQQRHALAGVGVAGGLWALWHLPLMVAGLEPWAEMANVAMMMFAYAWIFNASGGSVLLTMLFHTTNNTVGSAGFGPMFEGADESHRSLLLALIWATVASLLLTRSARNAARAERHSRTHETTEASRANGLSPALTSPTTPATL
jgi:hypothetical protein